MGSDQVSGSCDAYERALDAVGGGGATHIDAEEPTVEGVYAGFSPFGAMIFERVDKIFCRELHSSGDISFQVIREEVADLSVSYHDTCARQHIDIPHSRLTL